MGNNALGMLVVLGSLTAHQFESMIVKKYGSKHGRGGMFFNAILCLSATIYFFATDKGGFVLPSGVILYGLVNSLLYAIGFYSGYAALRSGSFGLTQLFTSFAGIIPILYGVIILKEPISPLMPIAVVLVFVSVFFMKYRKDSDETAQKLSFKWILSVVLAVISTAFISIVGKMQHNAFSDTYRNEYLIVSFVGSALWLMLMGLLFERDSIHTIKHGLLYGFGAGIFNGITNLLTLVAYNFIPLSFLSPVKTGLGIIISFLMSTLLYKETFSRRQKAGVILGLISVILINL